MDKKRLIYLSIIAVICASGVLGFIFWQQSKAAQKLSALLNQPANNEFQVSSGVLSSISQGLNQEQQIDDLRREIEELKNRPPQIVYKTVLTPASSSPLPDLKTKNELDQAKEQINSLQQQLTQLQAGAAVPTPANDAELIKNWQASDKVVQIACQNNSLGAWQMGSGVLISVDGKILTNEHVVKSSVGTALPDYCLALFSKDFDIASRTYKKEYRAALLGFFQSRDVALLKIGDVLYHDSAGAVQSAPAGNSFAYFSFSSAAPQIGDSVYIFGFPESANFSFSATKGIISNYAADGIYFGTDAQIDRGNSGGAAINRDGQLIGLPTYKFSSGGDYRGYILDINSLKL